MSTSTVSVSCPSPLQLVISTDLNELNHTPQNTHKEICKNEYSTIKYFTLFIN